MTPAMTRHDPELGPVRRCQTCREWWPDDKPFYYGHYRMCNACRSDRENGRAIPLVPVTHAATLNVEAKRRRDRERKSALRQDPVLGDKLRARQREAQKRYYERNRLAVLEHHRKRYASRLDRPVREGFGRPRIAA